jgi:hypothetical protein
LNRTIGVNTRAKKSKLNDAEALAKSLVY